MKFTYKQKVKIDDEFYGKRNGIVVDKDSFFFDRDTYTYYFVKVSGVPNILKFSEYELSKWCGKLSCGKFTGADKKWWNDGHEHSADCYK